MKVFVVISRLAAAVLAQSDLADVKITYSSGETYHGQWRSGGHLGNGYAHGSGLLAYSNGVQISGQIENGEFMDGSTIDYPLMMPGELDGNPLLGGAKCIISRLPLHDHHRIDCPRFKYRGALSNGLFHGPGTLLLRDADGFPLFSGDFSRGLTVEGTHNLTILGKRLSINGTHWFATRLSVGSSRVYDLDGRLLWTERGQFLAGELTSKIALGNQFGDSRLVKCERFHPDGSLWEEGSFASGKLYGHGSRYAPGRSAGVRGLSIQDGEFENGEWFPARVRVSHFFSRPQISTAMTIEAYHAVQSPIAVEWEPFQNESIGLVCVHHTYRTGDEYHGYWRGGTDGSPHGPGRITYSNGVRISGNFSNGVIGNGSALYLPWQNVVYPYSATIFNLTKNESAHVPHSEMREVQRGLAIETLRGSFNRSVPPKTSPLVSILSNWVVLDRISAFAQRTFRIVFQPFKEVSLMEYTGAVEAGWPHGQGVLRVEGANYSLVMEGLFNGSKVEGNLTRLDTEHRVELTGTHKLILGSTPLSLGSAYVFHRTTGALLFTESGLFDNGRLHWHNQHDGPANQIGERRLSDGSLIKAGRFIDGRLDGYGARYAPSGCAQVRGPLLEARYFVQFEA